MNVFIDVVLIVIAAMTIISHTFKGFVKSFFGLIKFGVSLLLSYLFAPILGTVLNDGFIYPGVYSYVDNAAYAVLGTEYIEGRDLPDVFNDMSEMLKTFFRLIGGDTAGVTAGYEGVEITEEGMTQLTERISAPISSFISNALAYIGIFIVSLIVLTILAFVLDKLCDLAGLRRVNRFFGFLLGIVSAFINLMFITSVITIILHFTESMGGSSIAEITESSVVYKFFSQTFTLQAILDTVKGINN